MSIQNEDTSQTINSKKKTKASFASRSNFNFNFKSETIKTRSNRNVESKSSYYPLNEDNDDSSSSINSNHSGTVITHVISHEMEHNDEQQEQQQGSLTTTKCQTFSARFTRIFNHDQLSRLEELKRLRQQQKSESSSSFSLTSSSSTSILFPSMPSFLRKIQLKLRWIIQFTTIQKEHMIKMEDTIMTWIDASPSRLTLTALFFMILSFWILSSGIGILHISTINHLTVANSTSDATTLTIHLNWSWLTPSCYFFLGLILETMNIVVTMCIKLFLFSTLNHWILDIILISIFDCMDIPALVKHSHNDDQNQRKLVQEQHQQQGVINGEEEAMKNPIIRKYVIRNIRTATPYITMLIIICGLLKGIVYIIFYHRFCYIFFNTSPSLLPSYCIQCIGLIQTLMMYLGVFLLVFHLVLAYSHQNRVSPHGW